MYAMFQSATAFNQQLDFNTTKVTDVRVVWSPTSTMRDLILIFNSYPTYHQMHYMFTDAAAFNQPLSFDTPAVTNVSAYACFESDDSKWETWFWFPFFPPNSLDAVHVRWCNSLRSGPASFWRLFQPWFQPDQFGEHIFELWVQYQKCPDQCSRTMVCRYKLSGVLKFKNSVYSEEKRSENRCSQYRNNTMMFFSHLCIGTKRPHDWLLLKWRWGRTVLQRKHSLYAYPNGRRVRSLPNEYTWWIPTKLVLLKRCPS